MSEPADFKISSNDNENTGTGKTQSSVFSVNPHPSSIRYTALTDTGKTVN